MTHSFYSLYTHGFLRTAVCIPYLRVADPGYNADRTLAMAQRAAAQQAAVVLFPELGLAAYSSDDLFHQDALLAAVVAGLQRVVDGSRDPPSVLLVGAPLLFEGKLFNCAAVIYRGQILGLVPKSYLPNYREFYEKRQFTAARSAVQQEVQLLGQTVPFGNDLLFDAVNVPNFVLHTEICEDVWAPLPPSTFAALAGATVLANLSASNITIGKADYRHQLCAGQSARCLAAYLYSAAGFGESTTDLAWDGHALIYENGELLAESARFAAEEQLIIGDVDLERLAQERMRLTSYNDAIDDYRAQVRALRRVSFSFALPQDLVPLQRHVERFPYVPSNPRERDDRCFEAYNIQVQGLMKRLDATGIKQVVIGVSGGLDSTHALIVAARTMDRLGLPRTNILAYTMPGFATTDRTKSNAWKLMEALGVSAHEIDIRPSALQMLRDLGHPFAEQEAVYDITFENVQAGERTSHLFRLANYNNALVLGTGDL
ncbi:MAG: NAD(+) synthase, partial [Caldilineaceae bacterium]|nr:NAD(+) synthase [Caldilineaceae bacterium]